MVRVSFLLTAVGCAVSLVSGSPVDNTPRAVEYTRIVPGSALDKTLAGRALSPMQWRGQLEAGRPEVHLKGDTFEDIEKQAKALNPNYSIFAPRNATAQAEALAARKQALSSRQTQAVHCGWPPNWAAANDWYRVQEGINYLRGITGDCYQNPGPGACGRVSCSWQNAIYYCNDNNYGIWEPCRWIGDVAAEIADACTYSTFPGWAVHGQAFDWRNWNTIVAHGSC
ncbi:hypothetical protein N658DRAFT_484419 [Parathielavia hyrcaniae]|uniref:Uncharacterized protein n=1 Tax=Parathielavia hyrcaniae TaxID=113614 RepID=A0AAN6Q4L3_9PEZI|nr:hypothetical protein N658DRAFT_484419 [Parathielavia hyrcaniae]